MIVHSTFERSVIFPIRNSYSYYSNNSSLYHIAGFFHGWKLSLFNFSWVDILAIGATLHRICIVEEVLVELILAF